MVTLANMLKMKTVNIQNCSAFPFMLPQTLKETGCWHVSNSLKKSINIATTTLREFTDSAKLDYDRFCHNDLTVVLTLSCSHRFKEFELSPLGGLRFSWLRFCLVLVGYRVHKKTAWVYCMPVTVFCVHLFQQLELPETCSWATSARSDLSITVQIKPSSPPLPPPPILRSWAGRRSAPAL